MLLYVAHHIWRATPPEEAEYFRLKLLFINNKCFSSRKFNSKCHFSGQNIWCKSEYSNPIEIQVFMELNISWCLLIVIVVYDYSAKLKSHYLGQVPIIIPTPTLVIGEYWKYLGWWMTPTAAPVLQQASSSSSSPVCLRPRCSCRTARLGSVGLGLVRLGPQTQWPTFSSCGLRLLRLKPPSS